MYIVVEKGRPTSDPVSYALALEMARTRAAEGSEFIVRVYPVGPSGGILLLHDGRTPASSIFEAWTGTQPGEWWWAHVSSGTVGAAQRGRL